MSSRESSANGTESGKLNRIVIGSMKLSNCAARTMYMNTMERMNAMTKLLAARPNSFDWPTRPVE